MKRLFGILILLFVLYFGIQIGFKIFSSEHIIDYEIKKDNQIFTINEIYTNRQKNETNNYFFTIKTEDQQFYFQTFYNMNKKEEIIKDIYYYKDNTYVCIFPIFRDNKVLTDIMCKRDNIVYNYVDINNEEIEKFANSIELYDKNKFQDNKNGATEYQQLTYYKNNVVKNHFFAMNNYRGVYTLNNVNLNTIYSVNLFNRDTYDRNVNIYFGKYYVVADYNSQYEFDKFYVLDIVNNKNKTIKYHDKFSFETYIQGVVDDKIYIFDPSSKRQYEINIKGESIVEISKTDNSIKFYKNGEWGTITISEAVNNKTLFTEKKDYENGEYIRIDKVGNINSGYYYLYKKNGNKYDVYRTNVQNKEQVRYLFTVSKLNSITYVSDYIYFIDGEEIKYYSDITGIKTIIHNSELTFNSNLLFNVYNK